MGLASSRISQFPLVSLLKYIDIATINYATDTLLSSLITAESEFTVAGVATDAPELPLSVEALLPPLVVEPPQVAVDAVSLACRHTNL